MGFTDGPYNLDGVGVIRGPEGRTLAQVGSLGQGATQVDEAVSNGFLFAASHGLYEALESAVGDMEYTREYGCCGESEGRPYYPDHHPNCWVHDARAALARARGEEG